MSQLSILLKMQLKILAVTNGEGHFPIGLPASV